MLFHCICIMLEYMYFSDLDPSCGLVDRIICVDRYASLLLCYFDSVDCYVGRIVKYYYISFYILGLHSRYNLLCLGPGFAECARVTVEV